MQLKQCLRDYSCELLYFKKKESINNLTFYLKEHQKKSKTKPKAGRRKEIRGEINKIEIKMNKAQVHSWEKINRIGKSLSRID